MVINIILENLFRTNWLQSTVLEIIVILIYIWYIKFKNVCILRDCI